MGTVSEDSMFLRPKDLRVGNYINYENTTHVVDEIHHDKLFHHCVNSHSEETAKYKEILSIPLSGKEIERLGFELDDKRVRNNPDLYFDNMGYCVEDDGGMYWICQHRDEDDVVRIVSIDFLHELQNIYFDLTKRELTY